MTNTFESARTPDNKVPLIVNGDDFGYSTAVNEGIIQAYREGILTSTSLMVNEEAAQDAVRLAFENPGLAVGLHLVLVLGKAGLPHSELPTITDQRGRFTDSSFKAGVQYYFSGAARAELRREMREQFDRFASTGLPFSHVDGHTHLHMHPVIFDELIRLCEEYGVRRVRVVKGEMKLSLKLDRKNLGIKLVWGTVFNLLGRWCEKKLERREFLRASRVYGLLQSGDMNENYLLGLIDRMDHESTEIYAHPLALDAQSDSIRENPGGPIELQAMLSDRIRLAIDNSGFSLATYDNLSIKQKA